MKTVTINKGGSRKPRAIRDRVIEISKTAGFGYTRIIGELRKPGIKQISRQVCPEHPEGGRDRAGYEPDL